MPAALLAAALAGQAVAARPVAETERAFAAMAQTRGQWTAFRAFADPAAIMFAPDKVSAPAFLAGRKDPAQAVMWWPARTISSCDGTLALSTGPWLLKASQGSFTTIWRNEGSGWTWLYDSGHDTPAKIAAGDAPAATVASCAGHPPEPDATPPDALPAPDLLVQYDDRLPGRAPPPPRPEGERLAGGAARDGTLVWQVDRLAGGEPGAHRLRLWRWNGRRMELAVVDLVGVAAP